MRKVRMTLDEACGQREYPVFREQQIEEAVLYQAEHPEERVLISYVQSDGTLLYGDLPHALANKQGE